MSTRDFKTSRRDFMASGLAGTAVATVARPVMGQTPRPDLADYEPEVFSASEWTFVIAATSRLIPSDGSGPSALDARVPVFIDRQLAGDFGAAADWYMEGPHDAGADPLFGSQTPLSPLQIYRDGIAAFNAWCTDDKGALFAELDPSDQDAALTSLENGDVDLPDPLRDFFKVLLQNTKEGYFADPKYGGNYGMAAWVHIGFPGARAAFLEWNDPAMDNVAYPLGPVSIAGDRT